MEEKSGYYRYSGRQKAAKELFYDKFPEKVTYAVTK